MTPTPEDHGKYLPCLNPHCKSHGKPHPNCRCYGMAEGGEVGHFCQSSQCHKPECEYFAEGGEALPSYNEVIGGQEKLPSYDDVVGKGNNQLPSYEQVVSGPKPPDVGGYLEQGKAALEGAAKGLLGGFAPAIEVGAGISTPEAIKKREEDFPITHGVAEAGTFLGSMLLGVGEAGLVAKGANAVAKASELGVVGSSLLKAAVAGSSFAASDEMSKAILGQPGSDPEHPVSAALLNIGAAGLLGAVTGGVFSVGEGMIGKGIQSEAGAKMMERGQKYLFELGQHGSPLVSLGVSASVMSVPAWKTSEYLHEKTGIPAEAYFPAIDLIYGAVGKKVVGKINPIVTSAAVKALMENSPEAIPNAVHLATQAARAAQKVSGGLSTIMSAGSAKIAPHVTDFARKQIKEFIDRGGVNSQLDNSLQENSGQQNFAHGGQVGAEPSRAFAKVFPQQNTLLGTAKGTVSNYLTSLKPQPNQQKLAFDGSHPNKEKIRQYERAIDLAANPLSILDRVNSGSLTPEDMKHFKSLYPGVHRYLSGEMTKKITEAQLKGEKPPFKKRQAMSLFLGSDLDSSLSPVAIQVVQALYAGKNMAQQQQAPAKGKKGTSILSKAPNSYLTDEQSREKRMQNAK